MIKVNKKVNLAQLDQEYNGQGLNGVLNESGDYVSIGLASNNTGLEKDLEACLKNHVAVFKSPTIEEKLASVDLSIEDLKTALGL
jgi:hypothetical protein